MEVFSNSTEMAFFKTQYHIKGLHPVEINTLEDAILKYDIDPIVLVGLRCWMVGRFDELSPGEPVADMSDEPGLHGDWVDVDFLAGMSQLEILVEIHALTKLDGLFFSSLKKAGMLMEHSWIDDNSEQWVIFSRDDFRELVAVIDKDDEVSSLVLG